MIVFPAHYITELAPFASKEETRYYLHGVAVLTRGDGLYLAATDGHRMMLARPDDETVVLEQGLLPKTGLIIFTRDNAGLLGACQEVSSRDGTRWIAIDAEHVTVVETTCRAASLGMMIAADEVLRQRRSDHSARRGTVPVYPDVFRAVPTGRGPAGPLTGMPPMDGAVMEPFMEFGVLRFIPGEEPGAPVLVALSGRRDLLGVMMGVKQGRGLPDWYDDLVGPVAERADA